MGALATSSSLINSQFITDMGTILTDIIGWITANSYLSIFLTAGLISLGLHLFVNLKGAVRV